MVSRFRPLYKAFLCKGSSGCRGAKSFAKQLPKKKPKNQEVDECLLPAVAIVGRPNVGKSALFNRLLQRQEALVKDTPGDHVTRDYRKGVGRLGDLTFQVYDTSGFEPSMAVDGIQARATQLTKSVLKQADIALFLIDARDGLSYADHDLTRWLTANVAAPVLLAVNKAERRRTDGSGVQEILSEATRLGLGEPVAISAETGEGMVDLYNGLQPVLDACSTQKQKEQEQQHPSADINEEGRISVAVIGLPNVGKSTLMNQLLGKERSLTGPEPGLTRDAVSDHLIFQGHDIEMVDTAGWLNRSRLRGTVIGGKLAEDAQTQTQRSYNRAHVVLLVADATQVAERELGLTRREVALAADVIQEGRSLLLALNKLDALPIERHSQVQAKVEEQLEQQLPEVRGAACLGISALNGDGLEAVMPTVVQAYQTWNQRISTARLNKWLVRTAERYAHDGGANQIMRVRYVTQVSARPPNFVAFVSGTTEFAASSLRFLGNALRHEFGFCGVPLRINVRLRKKGRPVTKNALKGRR